MLKQVMKSINLKLGLRRSLLVFLAVFCSACSTSHFPWVYRIDIEQGNIIDDDKLAQVQIGMTRPQVKYLLGTPLIQDTFDQDRWDYFYSFRTGDGVYERRQLTLRFNGNSLSAIEKHPIDKKQLKYW